MIKLFSLLTAGIVYVLGLSGCAETRGDPCQLLANEEVRMLDDEVVKSVWMPPGKDKTNELCMYVDVDDEPRFMLFSFKQDNPDPEKVVYKGMQDGGRVIRINGVGEQAAAGFHDGELKLFAARTGSGMVGFRARGIRSEESDAFVILKQLADTALSRLH